MSNVAEQPRKGVPIWRARCWRTTVSHNSVIVHGQGLTHISASFYRHTVVSVFQGEGVRRFVGTSKRGALSAEAVGKEPMFVL